jgi:hypothetical protein
MGHSDDYANRTLKKEAWNELLHLMINDLGSFSEEHKEKANEDNLSFLFYSQIQCKFQCQVNFC